MLITPKRFNEIGFATYGLRWKSIVAEAISVSNRMLAYYSDGAHPIPVHLLNSLAAHLRSQAAALLRMADELDGGKGSVAEKSEARFIPAKKCQLT